MADHNIIRPGPGAAMCQFGYMKVHSQEENRFMSQFFDPQDGVECNLGKMEDALALVHGLLFANVDEAWDGGLDEGAFRGAATLFLMSVSQYGTSRKRSKNRRNCTRCRSSNAMVRHRRRKADCFLTMNCETFRRSLKKRLQRPERSCICMWEEKKKGLKNRALSYFAGSKKKVGRTDFLRVKELLETRRPTAQQSRVASGALSRDDLFAWVKSLILREIKAVEILTRLVEGKTEGLADMATAYLQDAAGESPPPLDPKIKELLETARTKTEA